VGVPKKPPGRTGRRGRGDPGGTQTLGRRVEFLHKPPGTQVGNLARGTRGTRERKNGGGFGGGQSQRPGYGGRGKGHLMAVDGHGKAEGGPAGERMFSGLGFGERQAMFKHRGSGAWGGFSKYGARAGLGGGGGWKIGLWAFRGRKKLWNRPRAPKQGGQQRRRKNLGHWFSGGTK